MKKQLISKNICDFLCRNWSSYAKHHKSLSEEDKIAIMRDIQSIFCDEDAEVVEKAMRSLLVSCKYAPSLHAIKSEVDKMKSGKTFDIVSRENFTNSLIANNHRYRKLKESYQEALDNQDYLAMKKIGTELSSIELYAK